MRVQVSTDLLHFGLCKISSSSLPKYIQKSCASSSSIAKQIEGFPMPDQCINIEIILMIPSDSIRMGIRYITTDWNQFHSVAIFSLNPSAAFHKPADSDFHIPGMIVYKPYLPDLHNRIKKFFFFPQNNRAQLKEIARSPFIPISVLFNLLKSLAVKICWNHPGMRVSVL